MKKLVLAILFLLLLLFPIVVNGSLYYLGGDDMRLYYIFPEKYLENYVFNKIAGNTLAGANTGFATVAYYAPMFYFIQLLKLIPLNTQFLMYGLNLSLGFLFFYKFIGLYLRENWIAKITASFFYVLSPFLIITYYRNQMLSMYLISIIPVCFYFFLKGVRETKWYWSFLSVSIFSLFSTTVNTLPWLSAFILPSTFLLLYELFKRPKSFILNSLLVIVVFLTLNFYWIGDFVKSQTNSGGIDTGGAYFNSQSFAADNLRVMTGVSRLFSPIQIIFNSPETDFYKFQIRNFLNISFFLLLLLAGGFVYKTYKSKKVKYSVFLMSFLASWYPFSPNLDDIGVRLFLFIGRNFPVWGMYRNMFDKFSLPLAFYFALMLAISLYILGRKSKIITNIVCVLLFILTIYNARDFLIPKYSDDQELGRLTGEFNQDYRDLVSFINSTPDKSKVLWLPLNYPTYVNIEDFNISGHYYSGLSPLRILADRSDYAGGFSFITEKDFFVGDKLWQMFKNKDYESIGRLFQNRNARYIVLDKQDVPDTLKPYFYGGENLPILSYQNDEFYDFILGEKLAVFGSRYEIYKINPYFDSDLIYLTSNSEGLPDGESNLEYKKLDNHTYEVVIKEMEGDSFQLVFLEAFNKNWRISNKNQTDITEKHDVIFEYANKWNIKSLETNKIINQKLLLQFVNN